MNHTIIFQQFLGEVYNQVQGQKIILKSQKAQKKINDYLLVSKNPHSTCAWMVFSQALDIIMSKQIRQREQTGHVTRELPQLPYFSFLIRQAH